MSLRKKIAQLLIIGFEGTGPEDTAEVCSWIEKDQLGGLIFFDKDMQHGKPYKNIQTSAQVKALTQHLHAHNPNPEWPLWMAIDCEGGAVNRLKTLPDVAPITAAASWTACASNEIEAMAHAMADSLKNLGFNLDFSPVVDLALTERGIIGGLQRSFSSDPEVVVRIARSVIKALNQAGIVACLKHFPGHGSAEGDTHEGFVEVTDQYAPEELEPYRQFAKEDQQVMVMTAHVVNRHLDASGVPATLSYPILTTLLREEMGFKGVIISDDLQMNAIAAHYSLKEAAAQTLLAGSDMLILGNQLGWHSPKEVIDIIEQLVEEGVVPSARIEDAFQRVIALKLHRFL